MIYTNHDDFKDKEGRTDWSAYFKKQNETGETCFVCGKYMTPPKGIPTVCPGCINAQKSKRDIHHNIIIRCPKCRNLSTIEDLVAGDYYELYEDGEHGIVCEQCYCEFKIITYVHRIYVSPAIEQL